MPSPPSDVETWTPKKVLVVEDDDILLRALARALLRGGYEVVTATGVMHAREQLEAAAPDVIVCDMLLPDGSGLDVLDAARRGEPPVPVLMMTGAADASTVATAFAAGVTRYLRKPLAAVELIDAVVDACRPRPVEARALPATSPPSLMQSDRRFAGTLSALSLTLQPIASWSRSKVVAYEAQPTAGALGRVEMLAAARTVGRVPELGRAWRAAIAARMADLPANVGLHVSIDVDELADAELYSDTAPLAAHAARITLALTESAARIDLEQTFHRLALLRSVGYRIAVDRVGADGASLVALAATRPDVIALSPALLRDLRHDGIRQVVLRAVHHLATQLGADVVARGLDTGDGLASVLEAGGDLVQGDILAPPATEPGTIDFARVRKAIGVRRQGRTTHRGPSRGKQAAAAGAEAEGSRGERGGERGADQSSMTRVLHDDLATTLASLSELLATFDDDPAAISDHRGELRRLVDQSQTVADALASLAGAKRG